MFVRIRVSPDSSSVMPRLDAVARVFWRDASQLGIEYARISEGKTLEQNTRREPRFPFIASAELLESNSGSRMSTRISDLSLGGCYVDTINPFPDGTSVQLKIFTLTHTFEAPATVVYSHAHLGMGMKFGEVQVKFEEVLRLWLPEATQKAKEAHG